MKLQYGIHKYVSMFFYISTSHEDNGPYCVELRATVPAGCANYSTAYAAI